MNDDYTFIAHDGLTVHGPMTANLLHDYSESKFEIDALVASGDYFVTLATQLDDLDKLLGVNGEPIPELERAVRTLMYLQRHYTIIKKNPNYRQ